MKVVHLVTNYGGAYKAAKRISKALENSLDSEVITLGEIKYSFIKKIKNYIIYTMTRILCLKIYKSKYCTNADNISVSLLKVKKIQEADIIHLHWVTGGMLSNRYLKKIIDSNKVIVWTFHDMHPFTGVCHYSDGCIKYTNECGQCKQICSKKEKDYATKVQREKRIALQNADLIGVGCSSWITECAKSSTIMQNKKMYTIHNCIDTMIFHPYSMNKSRDILGIKCDKRIIAFGAMDTTDSRKGYKYLKAVIERLNSNMYSCLFFGKGEEITNLESFSMGYVSSEKTMAMIYSAANVFVAPSLEENLANTVLEALACGTPVVAFDIGGMSDLIEHKKNGYLAKPYEVLDLMKGIDFCCKNRQELSKYAREKVEIEFNEMKIGKNYFQLYKNALQLKKRRNIE